MPATRPADTSHTPQESTPPRQQDGLVIVNYGRALLVEDHDGRLYRCVARRNLEQLVSGDRVQWETTGAGEGVVNALRTRHTLLNRLDGSGRARPLAANIDRIIIVAAPGPGLDEFLIDKYLVAAEMIGATPELVVNKSDLLDAPGRFAVESRIHEFSAIGYSTLFSSALENTGIDQLAASLEDKTGILVGQSGVGKSSLIKRLLPELDIAIGRLSDASGQGRHTTTATTLYHLPRGGDLIDSPGVRDFRLEATEPEQLARGFREFRPRLGHCRFHNCRHLKEPGCAISDAVTRGSISQRRVDSYRNLLQWMAGL